MKARLSSSKKWTPFPDDLENAMREILRENYKDLKGTFIVEGRIYSAELLLRLGYLKPDSLKQVNFEVSLNFDNKKVMEEIHFCFDVAAAMLQTFVENPESDFPYQWKEIDFEKRRVFVQFSTINSELERQTDIFLGDHVKKLVYEDNENSIDEQDNANNDLVDNDNEETEQN